MRSAWPAVDRRLQRPDPSFLRPCRGAAAPTVGGVRAGASLRSQPDARYFIHPDETTRREKAMSTLKVVESKNRASDSMKSALGLGTGFVGPGRIEIDLPVHDDAFHAGRGDSMRAAIRHRLQAHAAVVKRAVPPKSAASGSRHGGLADLEAAEAAGERLQMHVAGPASVAGRRAAAAIDAAQLPGTSRAGAEIAAAPADRFR
jgi:hypothetical protein